MTRPHSKEWGNRMKDIPDQVRANSDLPFNTDADATEFVTQRILVSRERDFVTTYFTTTAGWGTTVVGSSDFTVWSNFATSDPVTDIVTGRRTIKTNTGFKPNTLVVGGQVWDKLKEHPDIIERVKYTQKGILTQDIVAQVFDVERLIIADSVYATNEEGGTAAYAQIFGKNALLCYSAPRPSLLLPSAGYTMAWTGYGGRNAYGITINRFRVDLTKSDRIEGEIAYDHKQVSPDLGYFLGGVVA